MLPLVRLASYASGVNGASPWAAGASESVSYIVEAALGLYSSGMVAEWSPSAESMIASKLPLWFRTTQCLV